VVPPKLRQQRTLKRNLRRKHRQEKGHSNKQIHKSLGLGLPEKAQLIPQPRSFLSTRNWRLNRRIEQHASVRKG
jgi:hypothetical protein